MTLDEQFEFKAHLISLRVNGCLQLVLELQNEAAAVFKKLGAASAGVALIIPAESQAHSLLTEINIKMHILLTFLFLNQCLKMEGTYGSIPELSQMFLNEFNGYNANPLDVPQGTVETQFTDGKLGND